MFFRGSKTKDDLVLHSFAGINCLAYLDIVLPTHIIIILYRIGQLHCLLQSNRQRPKLIIEPDVSVHFIARFLFVGFSAVSFAQTISWKLLK